MNTKALRSQIDALTNDRIRRSMCIVLDCIEEARQQRVDGNLSAARNWIVLAGHNAAGCEWLVSP